MVRAILASPILNCAASCSPTVFTRLLPKWSISSVSLLPAFKSNKYFIIDIISSLVSTVTDKSTLRFNFLFSLYLPTLSKSYFFGLKNSRSMRFLAVSRSGASPDLNWRYMVSSASSVDLDKSFIIVFAIIFIDPDEDVCFKTFTFLIFSFDIAFLNSGVKFESFSAIISPVSVFTTSSTIFRL